MGPGPAFRLWFRPHEWGLSFAASLLYGPRQYQVVVRDLGSTNGIQINGMRVEAGSLRPGDELSIAHFRYRLEGEEDFEQASDPAIRGQDSTPDSSRLSNWIHSPKWGFGLIHKG
jgi:hypothetical protein